MMTIAELVAALVAAGAPPQAIDTAVRAFIEASSEGKKGDARQERNRRYYQKRRLKSVLGGDLIASENVLKASENPPSRTPMRVLCGEEVLIKELPTVVRKSDDEASESLPDSDPSVAIDLFGKKSPTDLRQAKVAADKRVIEFVGEAWNSLAQQFPRMARISVVPGGSPRESAILARTKDLRKDYDFQDPEAGWRDFFAKIRGSAFLRGEAPPGAGRERSFKPRLDAVIAPAMFLKIMENQFVDEVQIRKQRHNGSSFLSAR